MTRRLSRNRRAGSGLALQVRWGLTLLLALFLASSGSFADSLETPLVRDRVFERDIDSFWSVALKTVSESDVLINTIDPESHLLTFTVPIPEVEIPQVTLERLQRIKGFVLAAHMVLWGRVGQDGKLRVFLKSAVGREELTFHSNGYLEKTLFDALEKESAWRPGRAATSWRVDAPVDKTWERIMAQLSESGWKVHASSREDGILTATFRFASGEVGAYAKGDSKPYHAGVGHLALALEPQGSETQIRCRTFLLQPGVYAAPILESTSALENLLIAATSPDSKNLPQSLPIKERAGYWRSMFGDNELSVERVRENGWRGELQGSIETAWDGILEVVTQVGSISHCDRGKRFLTVVTTHPTRVMEKIAVHPLGIYLAESDDGALEVFLLAEAAEHSDDELEREYEMLFGKLHAQLHLKEELEWLPGS